MYNFDDKLSIGNFLMTIEYLRNGGNIYILSEKLLGHSDLTITRRYLAIVDSDAKLEHHKASPADHWRL